MINPKSLNITDVRDSDGKQKALRKLQLIICAFFAFVFLPACDSKTPTKSMIDERDIASSPSSIEKHVVKHAFGEMKIPVNPQRVVVLNMAPLDTALAVGIKPIGGIVHGFDNFPTYLSAQTKDIGIVGARPQPNLEKIMLLKPDLILSNARDYQHIYNKLSQIAPTFMMDAETWKERVLLYSEAMGRKPKAEELLSEYNARIVKLRQELGEQLANTEVSVIFTWDGEIWVVLKNSLPGEIFDEIGIAVPPVAQNKNVGARTLISQESIASIDSDVIFLLNFDKQNTDNSINLSELTSDPIFSGLKAVKQGRVYQVDGEVWGMGNSIQAANLVLDDLFKYLVEER